MSVEKRNKEQEKTSMVVEGFLFANEAEAAQARKEAEGVKYVKEKAQMDDPEMVLRIYNKMIQQRLFDTAVGYSYLKDLQEYLQSIRVVRDVDLRYLYPEGRYFPDSGAASAGGGESPQGEARAGTKAEDADRGKKCGLQETLPHCALDRLYSGSMCCGDVCNYGDDQ